MTAEVQILISESKNVKRIPISTLRDSLGNHKYTVMVVGKDGNAENVTSGKFIKRHGLVSPNSVKSAIPALIDKGLLTQDKGIYKVYDLFFALWLIKNF